MKRYLDPFIEEITYFVKSYKIGPLIKEKKAFILVKKCSNGETEKSSVKKGTPGKKSLDKFQVLSKKCEEEEMNEAVVKSLEAIEDTEASDDVGSDLEIKEIKPLNQNHSGLKKNLGKRKLN